jgi:hypothetical protein
MWGWQGDGEAFCVIPKQECGGGGGCRRGKRQQLESVSNWEASAIVTRQQL